MTDSWWKQGVIYQIYPRSFQDSNGDGVGDIPGIISRLDYLAWLGVDAIWLSPIYPSPMADFGYDVSDYTNIEPVFGTLEDFDRLVAEARARNIRILLDFVPNHTSDQHPWFLESRASRINAKRDWYIWKDAKSDGSPPNNWLSVFGGSAWEWDAQTRQYYLHSFLREQPDLNWRNPEVIEAMMSALRFWLERGISGFRVDVIHFMLKDDQWRDDPPNPNFEGGNPWDSLLHKYSSLQPGIYDLIRQFQQVINASGRNVFIGEINYFAPIEEIVSFYDIAGMHLPFNFWLILLPWEAQAIREFVDSFEANIPAYGWPNYVTGNHDRSRLGSRVGAEHIRTAAMLLLTLRGTPFIYYGEELGMLDVHIPRNLVQDPWEINIPGHGRDPVRTPIAWDTSLNGGFTTGQPWLPLADNYAVQNVKTQQQTQNSVLNLYRSLLDLRKNTLALNIGDYMAVDTGNSACYVYERTYGEDAVLVALNFSSEVQYIKLNGVTNGDILLSTEMDREGQIDMSNLMLRSHEGCIIRLSK